MKRLFSWSELRPGDVFKLYGFSARHLVIAASSTLSAHPYAKGMQRCLLLSEDELKEEHVTHWHICDVWRDE